MSPVRSDYCNSGFVKFVHERHPSCYYSTSKIENLANLKPFYSQENT